MKKLNKLIKNVINFIIEEHDSIIAYTIFTKVSIIFVGLMYYCM